MEYDYILKPKGITQIENIRSLDPIVFPKQIDTVRRIDSLTGTYWGRQYLTQKKAEENKSSASTLINYNDKAQINSLADVLLGTFNKNMKHSKMLGINWANVPILNIIPNSLEYMYNYVGKPLYNFFTFKDLNGDAKVAYNLIQNFGETIGVIGNIFKGQIFTAKDILTDRFYHNTKYTTKDIINSHLESLKKATIGDEEGRQNNDWNIELDLDITGNETIDRVTSKISSFVLNIGLEILSDPVNWYTWSKKSSAKEGAETVAEAVKQGDATVEITPEFVESLSKDKTFNIDLLNINKNKVNNTITDLGNVNRSSTVFEIGSINEISDDLADTILKGNLGDTIYNISDIDLSKNIIYTESERFLKLTNGKTISEAELSSIIKDALLNTYGDSNSLLVKEILNKRTVKEQLQLLFKPTNTTLPEKLQTNFVKNFYNGIEKYVGSSGVEEIIAKGMLAKGMNIDDALKYISGIYNKISLEKMSQNVLLNTSLKSLEALNKAQSYLNKGVLSMAGFYPLAQIGSTSYKAIKNVYNTRALNDAFKINANLNNVPNFLSKTSNNVTDSIIKNIDLMQIAMGSKSIDPNITASVISKTLMKTVDTSREILRNTELSVADKISNIIKNYNVIRPEKFQSLDEIEGYLRSLDINYKKVGNKELITSGFEQYIDEFKSIKRIIEAQSKSEHMLETLRQNKSRVDTAQDIIEVTDMMKDLKVPIDSLPNVLENTLSQYLIDTVLVNALRSKNPDLILKVIETIKDRVREDAWKTKDGYVINQLLNDIYVTAIDTEIKIKHSDIPYDLIFGIDPKQTLLDMLLYGRKRGVKYISKDVLNPKTDSNLFTLFIKQDNDGIPYIDPQKYYVLKDIISDETLNKSLENSEFVKTLKERDVYKGAHNIFNKSKYMENRANQLQKASLSLANFTAHSEAPMQPITDRLEILENLKKEEYITETQDGFNLEKAVKYLREYFDFPKIPDNPISKLRKAMGKTLNTLLLHNLIRYTSEIIITDYNTSTTLPGGNYRSINLYDYKDIIISEENPKRIIFEPIKDGVEKVTIPLKVLKRSLDVIDTFDPTPMHYAIDVIEDIDNIFIALGNFKFQDVIPENTDLNYFPAFELDDESIDTFKKLFIGVKVNVNNLIQDINSIKNYAGTQPSILDVETKYTPEIIQEKEELWKNLDNVIDELEDSLRELGLGSINRSLISSTLENDLYITQLDKAEKQLRLTDAFTNSPLMLDEYYRNLIDNASNIKNGSLTVNNTQFKLDEDQVNIFTQLFLKDKGFKNYYNMLQRIEALGTEYSKEKTSKGIPTAMAVKSTIAKFDLPDAKSFLNNTMPFMKKLKEGLQGYGNNVTLLTRHSDLDTLNKELKITESELNTYLENAVDNKGNKIDWSDITRHRAVYDAINTLVIAEKKLGNAEGYFEDSETTGVEENARLMEYALVHKDYKTNKIIVDVNIKLQLPREQLVNNYNLDIATIINLGFKDEDEFYKYYTAKSEKDIVDSNDIALAILKNRMQLPNYTTIAGYNINAFDEPVISNNIKHSKWNYRVTDQTRDRLARGLYFRNQQKDRYPTYTELHNEKQFKFRDIYSEITKDTRWVPDNLYIQRLEDILIETAELSLRYEDVYSKLGMLTPMFERADSSLIDLLKQELDILGLNQAILDIPELANNDNLIRTFGENTATELAIEVQMEAAQALKNKSLLNKIAQVSLDPQLFTLISETYIAMINTIKEFNMIDDSYKNNLISGANFNFDSKKNAQYVIDTMKALYNPLAQTSPEIAQALTERLENLKKDFKKYKFDSLMYNMTEILGLGLNRPILAVYKIPKEMKYVLDLPKPGMTDVEAYIAKELYNSAHNKFSHIINYDMIEIYKDDIINMLIDLKENNITINSKFIKLDIENLPYNFAILDSVWKSHLSKEYSGKVGEEQAFKFMRIMREKYPDLIYFIDSGQAYIKVNLKDSARKIEYVRPAGMQDESIILNNYTRNNLIHAKINRDIKSYHQKIGEAKKVFRITDNNPLNNLKVPEDDISTLGSHLLKSQRIYNSTFDKLNRPTVVTKVIDGKKVKAFYGYIAWELHQILQKNDIDLFNYIIGQTGNRFAISIINPNDQYYTNKTALALLTQRKKALKDLGIDWKWNEKTNTLVLSASEEVRKKLTLNKNEYTQQTRWNPITNQTEFGSLYLYNNAPIPYVGFDEMPIEDFKRIIDYNKLPKKAQEFFDELIEVKKYNNLYDPRMIGRIGIMNNLDDYNVTMKSKNLFKFKKSKEIQDAYMQMPYYNTSVFGDYEGMRDVLGNLDPDFYSILTSASSVKIHHSFAHLEAAMFIQQSGMSINNNDWFNNLSNKEIINILKNNPDKVLVYLAEQDHSKSKFELRRIKNPTEKTIEAARKANATILPYSTYTTFANFINRYEFNSKPLQLYSKYLGMLKRGVLLFPRVILNNLADSTMKNFLEIGNIPEVLKYTFECQGDLINYDAIIKDIIKENPMGKLTLRGIDEHFVTGRETRLTRETFDAIYAFDNNNGINTTRAQIDTLYNAVMRPNAWIERLSRWTLYKNSKARGYSDSESKLKVDKIHFNYETEDYSDFVMKNVFPFYTFFSNSISWFLDMINNHPNFIRNFFNIYRAIWDIQDEDQDELENNSSLLYQIILGKISLSKLFGFQDKPITKIVNTKYGSKKIEVTNTATLNISLSIFDTISFFASPITYLKNKLAPPLQVATDSIQEMIVTGFGTEKEDTYSNIDNLADKYGSYTNISVRSLTKDLSGLKDLIPYIGAIENNIINNKVQERTGNNLLGAIGKYTGIVGATSRWGEFKQPLQSKNYNRTYYNRKYNYNNKYYSPYSYNSRTYNRTYWRANSWKEYRNTHPNTPHNVPYRIRFTRLSTIPEYIFSNGGLNKRRKNKMLSWLRMNSYYRTKTTLKRFSTPHLH